MSLELKKIRDQLDHPTALQLGRDILTPDVGDANQTVDSVIGLFEAILETPEITIADAQLDDGNTAAELVIAGKVSALGVKDATVTILLNEDDETGKPALRMTVAMPDHWTLADSFPALSDWVGGSPLEEMVFRHASLILSTADSDDEDIVAGLNLKADIDLTGPFDTAASLTGAGVSSLHLGGWIKLIVYPAGEEESGEGEETGDGGENLVEAVDPADDPEAKPDADARYPLFDLRAELTTEAPFGPLKLTSLGVGFRNDLLLEGADSERIRMKFFASLLGVVKFGPVTVDARALISSEPDEPIEFAFSFEGANLPDLGDVVYLLGGDDLTTSLPEGLESTGGFSVTSLTLKFLPEEKRLTLASLSMENRTKWVLLEDVLTVEQLQTEWLVIDPSRPRTRQLFGNIFGSIAVGEAQLQASAELPDGNVAAWLVEGKSLEVVTLVGKLIPGLDAPDAVSKFAITALDLKANPGNETFHFSGELGDVWPVETGLGGFRIKSLTLNVDLIKAERDLQFGGVFQLVDSDFIVLVEHSDDTWVFSAELDPESEINITKLVERVFAYDLGETFGVENIRITELGMQFGTGKTEGEGQKSSYSFHGKGEWDLTLPGLDQDFNFTAGLEIARETGGEVEGRVSGSIGAAIEGFEYLQLTLAYEFEAGNQALLAELTLGKFGLDASLEKSAQKTILSFDTSKSSLTCGDILTFLAGLVDPGIEEFSLDPPWNELDSILLPGLRLEINLTDKSVTAGISESITILDVVTIQNLSLTYEPKDKKEPRGFKVAFDMSFPGGETPQPVSWDPLNDPAPASPVPSKAAFELNYLGLGQHIALRNASGFTSVEGIVNELRDAVLNDGSGQLLIYNRDSDWLIGAKFSLVDLLDMSIIFNDPVLYGMVISLGDKAKPFTGLKFEILYRRISDTIGVYHTELTLPDDFRHFNVGAVAITLPVMVLDIYTNGDFAVDIGFPWNGDWSRSALAEASIFTGSGGFYFAKLSRATATGLPAIPPGNGEFGLVLKFGLGLRLGVGRSFQRGPLKAELSLTIQGIFEGILAWYHYPPALRRDPEMYYHMQATVQLVGRLYGAVDFEVIKVEVEVIVYAGIQLTIDTYEPILVVLVAGVSVRATVTILFIEVDFTFDLTIRESFPIGEGSTPPWKNLPGVRTVSALESRMAFAAPLRIEEAVLKVWDTARELKIWFQPAFTEGLASDRLENQDAGESEEEAEVKGIALLFIENSKTGQQGDAVTTEEAGFNLLTQAMLAWAIDAYKTIDPQAGENISRDNLIKLYQALETDEVKVFSFEALMEFLAANFTFKLAVRDNEDRVSATIFPMFPQLSLMDSDGNILAEFASKNQKTAGDLKTLLGYFDELKVSGTSGGTENRDSQLISMAIFTFVDYFAMLTRSAVQSAIDAMQENGKESITRDELFADLAANGKYNQLAGIVSRFMLYGLRLPFSLPLDHDTKTYPLYELTGQQFTIPGATNLDDFKLGLKPTDDMLPAWLNIGAGQPSLTIDLHDRQKSFIEGLEALTFSPTLLVQGPLQLFGWAPLRFDFSQPLPYGEKTIWSFPANLVSRLTSLSRDESLEFKVFTSKVSEAVLEAQETLSPDWGTLIEFTVHRVPSADGTRFLENIYMVAGIGGRDANSSGEDYLEELIAKTTIEITISLLFEDPESKTLKEAGDRFLLLKTNLAGGTGDGALFGATQNDAADFVRLLWEAGKTEGGTYLHLQGLPDEVLNSGEALVLRLLAIEKDLGGHPIAALGRRHNCMVSESEIAPDKAALYAEAASDKERIKALNVPPGHFGFRITRKPVRLDPENQRWEDELDNLFQLLSYRLLETSNFTGSRWGMPVGPTVDPVIPEDPDDDIWIYERVIPAFRFALGKAGDANDGLPPASRNPYTGIGNDAALKVEFEFQDVYGNHTSSIEPPEPEPEEGAEPIEPAEGSVPVKEILPEMDIPVGYTDAILGLKGWPGAVLTYRVESGEQGPQLVLTPHLDLTHFSGDDMVDKVKTARAVYEQLYYQVHQNDLSFTLTTSLNPSLEQVLDKSRFTGFVDQAYLFFDFLAGLAEGKLPTLEEIKNRNTSVLPPDQVVMPPVPLSGKLPDEMIIPVTVQIKMQRNESLVHPDFTDVETVFLSTTMVAPLAVVDEDSQVLALRSFALDFEAAFPGLKLMSGNVDDSFGQPATLWAVQFGTEGVDYRIDPDEQALFFAPAPLSNKLFSGEVKMDSYTPGTGLTSSDEKQYFGGVDLDTWGREFLSAVDAFLEADLSIPAYRLEKGKVENILGSKRKLAAAIASQVQPVLLQNNLDAGSMQKRRIAAADLFQQHVLTRLENAYTIETIVQKGVKVELAKDWTGTIPPRLSGKPLALDLNGQPDYTLSTAKIPLTGESSTLTFVYNTPAPERERQVKINLSYHVNALEFKITPVEGMDGYEDSSWLTFILPPGETGEGERNHIGEVEIPVPLRVFPTPPSLIMQRAVADMDSLESLEHIREWQYNYLYEHLDAAQDAIETIINYNVEPSKSAVTPENSQTKNNLFVALANFHTLYPQLLPDMMELLGSGLDDAKRMKAQKAVESFAKLVEDVANTWGVSAPVESDTTDKGYYEIRMGDADEENAIVEFHPNGAGDPIHLQNELASMRVKALHGSIYGVPNIPDFMVSVDNRDIIEQQNAWAEVWLSRNRSLGDRPTHPAFVYRTSRVRFGNMITPLLVNSKEWHIEELSSDHQRPFAVHLEQLFKTLLPENATKAYDLRIGCGYAFALAEGAVGKPDLLVPLPVTLGPRFSVNPGRGMLKATAPFRQNLETAIHQWWNVNQPSKSKGMFVFKLDIHSSAGSLPLLRIDDLRLELKNITDL